MGCCSSKEPREINELQKNIQNIQASCADIAQALDAANTIAETFVSELGDKENRLTDTRCSNFEQFYTKLMNVYTTAIPLLMSVHAAAQKKEPFVHEVNTNLNSIVMLLEGMLKTKFKGHSRHLGEYQEEHRHSTTGSSSNVQIDNVSQIRKSMESSLQSLICSIQNNVQILEDEVRSVKDKIEKFNCTSIGNEQNLNEIKSILVSAEKGGEIEVGDFERIKIERDMLRNKEEEFKSQIGAFKETISKLLENENISKIHATKAESQRRELEQTNLLLRKENEEIKREIETLKKRPVYEVQLFSENNSDLIKNVEKMLMTELRSRLNNKGKDVEFIKCESTSNIQTDKPVILLCINASRLGTDASTLVKKLEVSSKMMAVLVFHHKDEHALPAQASDRVLSGPEFKGIGGIYDVAFKAEKGIYPCEMNELNIPNIIKFIAFCNL